MSHLFRPVHAPFFDDDGILKDLDVQSYFFALHSGYDMRVVFVRPRSTQQIKGSVIIFIGHDDFAEKYLTTCLELTTRGFQVILFEYPGQGLGSRFDETHPRRRSAGSFTRLVRDLIEVVRDDILVRSRGPFFAIGIGFGGLLLYHVCAQRGTLFDRIILIGPMFGDHLSGRSFLRFLSNTIKVISGFGHRYVLGAGDTSIWTKPFTGHPRVKDDGTLREVARCGVAHPELLVGGVTHQFLFHLRYAQWRAFRLWRQMRTPVLCITGSEDHLSDISLTERQMGKHVAGHALVIKNAGHDLFLEGDLQQKQLWALIDHFIPGGSDYLFD